METCESCRFYFPTDKQGIQGECKWEPPKLLMFPKSPPVMGAPPLIELRSLFPPVKSGSWCGQWEVRRKPPGTFEIVPENKKTLKLAEGD